MAGLPIDAAAAGNHEFDDGVAELREATRGWDRSPGSSAQRAARWVVARSRPGRAGDPGPVGPAGRRRPAGHAHVFAASVLIIDLPAAEGSRAVVRGWFPVPPARLRRAAPASQALEAAAANVVGESRHTWLSRTGADRHLPDLIADALREATGAQAGMVLAAQHLTRGSLNGVTAALRAGPVTELDLMWLFALPDNRPVTVELRPGELAAAVAGHDAIADPGARHADRCGGTGRGCRPG